MSASNSNKVLYSPADRDCHDVGLFCMHCNRLLTAGFEEMKYECRKCVGCIS